MKNLYLFLVAVLLTLTACGAPFEASSFTESAVAGAGAAGRIGQGHAGAETSGGSAGASAAPEAGAAGQDTEGGAAGAPEAQGGAGSAGAAQGGNASAGAAGSIAVPPEPPCSPATSVSGKTKMDLGIIKQCLKTTAPLDYFACSNWDGRVIKVNGHAVTCWVKFPVPTPIDGYNYIEVSPGDDAMASFDWSFV